MAQKLTTRQKRALKKEAGDWDSLSDADFAQLFADGEPVKTRLRRPPLKKLTISLDEQTLNLLKRLARRKQVGPTQLAALWIAERLAEEPSLAPESTPVQK